MLMISGERDDRRRIIAVRLIELVVIILRLAETVDDIAEVEEEQRPVLDVVVGEIADQLVGDEILICRAAGIAGIAGGAKDQLFVRFIWLSRSACGMLSTSARLSLGSGKPRGAGNGSGASLCARLSASICL